MQWRTVVRRTLFRSIFAAAAVVSVIGLALAQEPTPTLEPGAVPDGPFLEPSMQATADAREAALAHEFESRSMTDFRVAYLIAPDAVPADSLMSEQSFSNELGADVIHDWETFSKADAGAPYQFVLIHDSAYAMIDTAWTQRAYRSGVIITGIGMPFEHLVEITGDRCAKPANPSYADRYADWIIGFHYAVEVDNESLRDVIDDHLLNLCNDDLGGESGEVAAIQGVYNFPLTHPDFMTGFVATLVMESIYYDMEPRSK